MSKNVSRKQVLDEIKRIMADGRIRTGRELATLLTSKGYAVDKSTVNSVMHSEGRGTFAYDLKTFTYTLVTSTSKEKDSPLSIESRIQSSLSFLKREPHTVSLKSSSNATTQSANVSVSGSSGIKAKILEMASAVKEEIDTAKKSGGLKTYLTGGTYIGDHNGFATYVFSIDADIHFPDDTKIQIEHRRKRIDGILLSTDNVTIVVALNEYIGETVPVAMLSTEPWFLLDALRTHLYSIEQDNQRLVFAEKLLSKIRTGRSPRVDLATTYVEKINNRLAQTLNLNSSQMAAIGHVLANEISFIWGPPGTGKSTTLGATAASLIEDGQTVLILAHSNVAVDVAMMSIGKLLQDTQLLEQGHILRLGVTQHTDMHKPEFEKMHARGIVRRLHPELIRSIEKLEQRLRQLIRQTQSDASSPTETSMVLGEIDELREQIKQTRKQIAEYEKQLLTKAQVVGCTFSKLAIMDDLQARRFDAVLIDEASMAYVPHCVFASAFANKRVAIYGDFRQLPPIAQSEHVLVQKWLLKDIFEHAGITESANNGSNDLRLRILDIQYRMHTKIATIPNQLFYQNRLQTPSEVNHKTQLIAAQSPEKQQFVFAFDTSHVQAHCTKEGESKSRFNLVSAIQSLMLLDEAVQSRLSVGIETPYNAQARLINRMIRDLSYDRDLAMVSTVHRFQGSERDVIIFDMVESSPQKPSKLMMDEGETPDRLANVAVSRARGKFILVGEPKFIEVALPNSSGFKKLVRMVASKGKTIYAEWSPLASYLVGSQNKGIIQYPNSADAKKTLEADLLQAREEIAIAWPSAPHQSHFSDAKLLAAQKKKLRFYVTGSGNNQFFIGLSNAQIWASRSSISYGVIGIDRKILWVFLAPEHEKAAVLRFEMPQTVQLLYAFYSLVPKDEINTEMMESLIEQGKSPLKGMPCPRCEQPLWPDISQYGNVILRCTNSNCGYTQKMNTSSATQIARLMGITCTHCGGQAVGRSSPNGIFLGCSNYPQCRWRKAVEDLI